MAMSLPGTRSGLPAGPAAPGELAVPAPDRRRRLQGVQFAGAGHRAAARPLPPLVPDPVCPAAPGAFPGSAPGIRSCRSWPGPARAAPGHRGAAVATLLPGTSSELPAGLLHPVSSRYPPADRRRRRQQGGQFAGVGHRAAARPLPPLVPDPVCPAAPGAPPGCVLGISSCRGWPGPARAAPGHRGAAVATLLPGTSSELPAGLLHPVSSRYPPADRRRRRQQGGQFAGVGHRAAARPLPPLVSDPVCPAAPGAPPGCVLGISSCRGWPGSPWTVPAAPGHRGAACGHVSPWYQLRAAGKACSTR